MGYDSFDQWMELFVYIVKKKKTKNVDFAWHRRSVELLREISVSLIYQQWELELMSEWIVSCNH